MAFVYHIHLKEDQGDFSKGYVGFTSGSVENRWQEHKEESQRQRCAHYPLYRAMNKYTDLVVTTLVSGSNDYCLDIEFCLRPQPKIGWNICCGGDKGMLGRTHSKESRQKIKENGTGLKRTALTRQNISKSLRGIKRTEETRNRLSEKARNRSAEHRDKLNTAHRNISDETRRKMSESAKNLYKNTPWTKPDTNKKVWSHATYIFCGITEGTQCSTIAGNLSLKPYQIRTVRAKVLSGWNPTTDVAYQEWLQKYNEQKELNEATPTN